MGFWENGYCGRMYCGREQVGFRDTRLGGQTSSAEIRRCRAESLVHMFCLRASRIKDLISTMRLKDAYRK